MSAETYDVKSNNAILDGVVLTGFAKGSAITAEKKEDNFTTYVGMMGDTTIAETYDDTGEATIKLKSTSPSVPYMEAWARKRGDAALFPFQIVSLGTNAVSVSGTKCRITKSAKIEIGPEESEREYKIFIADYMTK